MIKTYYDNSQTHITTLDNCANLFNSDSLCPICQYQLKYNISNRIINKTILYLTEIYYTCNCLNKLWIIANNVDNNKYINKPSIWHELELLDEFTPLNIVQIESDQITYLKELTALTPTNLDHNNLNVILIPEIINLSQNMQLLNLINPSEDAVIYTKNEIQQTKLNYELNEIAKQTSKSFWYRYRSNAYRDSIITICKLLEKPKHPDDYNLDTINQKIKSRIITEVLDKYDTQQPQSLTYLKDFQEIRNKSLAHMTTKNNFSGYIYGQTKMTQIYKDIINCFNSILNHLHIGCKLKYIERLTESDIYYEVINILKKVEIEK
ncbi:hypothetical protein C6497_13890 [Candidatus Poribacteria bacterium]|nr:MAG: hypothetical protein C6497_13890 [Candidatus Poribacteria bacterium]